MSVDRGQARRRSHDRQSVHTGCGKVQHCRHSIGVPAARDRRTGRKWEVRQSEGEEGLRLRKATIHLVEGGNTRGQIGEKGRVGRFCKRSRSLQLLTRFQ